MDLGIAIYNSLRQVDNNVTLTNALQPKKGILDHNNFLYENIYLSGNTRLGSNVFYYALDNVPSSGEWVTMLNIQGRGYLIGLGKHTYGSNKVGVQVYADGVELFDGDNYNNYCALYLGIPVFKYETVMLYQPAYNSIRFENSLVIDVKTSKNREDVGVSVQYIIEE